MAVAYRSGNQTNFTTANTITLTEPTGAAADDILIAGIYHEGGASVTITPVAAWNLIGSMTTTTNGETTLAVYWFRRTGAAPSYKFDLSSSVVVQGAVIAVSGAITTGDPQGATATINKSDANTTITFTGITTTSDNSLVIGIAADFTFEARTNVDFVNERLDSDANKAIWIGDDGLKTPAGATGNQTITTATNDSWVSVLLAIKPPDAAGTPSVSTGFMTTNTHFWG